MTGEEQYLATNSTFELGEINGSAAYRLASQVVIPRLRAEVFPAQGATPFSLRDAVYKILQDEVAQGHLTQAEIDTTSRVSASGVNTSLASQTRWYVRHLLKMSGAVMLSDVRGLVVLTDPVAALEDAEEDEEDEETITGSIYAYTFPSLRNQMLKVGKASGNVNDRITQQMGTGNPEAPVILRVWPVADINAMETAIHGVLKARGKWVEAPKAREWFRTTVDEVDQIIGFVKGS